MSGAGLPVWKEHGIYGTGIILIAEVLLSLLALATDRARDYALLSLGVGIIASCMLSVWIFLLFEAASEAFLLMG